MKSSIGSMMAVSFFLRQLGRCWGCGAAKVVIRLRSPVCIDSPYEKVRVSDRLALERGIPRVHRNVCRQSSSPDR
ncbi:MAG: hypothetical protein MI861_17945 [Pirellulales bacterium]|nr:hypothetical protein [Pirellulales bacterium]